MKEPLLIKEFNPPEKAELNPQNPNPCFGCRHCCEYVALEIDKPVTVKHYDQIRWYLIHRNVWVYVNDDKEWYIQFNTPCEKLEGYRCGDYASRRMVCRDYEVESCHRYCEGEIEKYLFKNETDFLKYLVDKRPVQYQKLKAKVKIPFSARELKEGERSYIV